MAQGRISLSTDLDGAYAFVAGRETAAAAMRPGADLPAPVMRSRGVKVSFASGSVPETGDNWILESIERKRASISQAGDVQRQGIEEFVELLNEADCDRCEQMVDLLAAQYRDPQKLSEALFEPAARMLEEVGASGEFGAVQLTIAMSRIQRLFRRTAAEWPAAAAPDMTRRALLTTPAGSVVDSDTIQQEMFGLCVVDDAFRRAGWDVDCLGCDQEARMFRLASANRYQVVAVYIGGMRPLDGVAAMIRKLRSRSNDNSIVIIAGGGMVIRNPQGVIDAGFDLLAVDALSAVSLAEAVVASKTPSANWRMAAE